MTLLERVVVPVATEEDAEQTAAALAPYLGEIDLLVGVHVIEKAGGGIDKAPLGSREEEGEQVLDVFAERMDADVDVRTELVYATDVVDGMFETAADVDATAVVFTARPGSRIVRLLSGDTAATLVSDPDLPVVSLPT